MQSSPESLFMYIDVFPLLSQELGTLFQPHASEENKRTFWSHLVSDVLGGPSSVLYNQQLGHLQVLYRNKISQILWSVQRSSSAHRSFLSTKDKMGAEML